MATIIDKNTLQHVATLARLEITPDEEQSLLGDLERILEHVALLAAVDTTATVVRRPTMKKLRPDVPAPGMDGSVALAAAPEARDGFVVVHDVMGSDNEQ